MESSPSSSCLDCPVVDPERHEILQPLLTRRENDPSNEDIESKLGIPCPSRIDPLSPERSRLRNRTSRRRHTGDSGSDTSTTDRNLPSPEVVAEASNRILDRDAPFFQSRGRWSVQHLSRQAVRYHHSREGGEPTRVAMSKQFWDGWFHALAYQRTIVLLSILVLLYSAIVVNFAVIYYALSTWGQKEEINPDGSVSVVQFCDMDITTHMEALYFSLSTMSTIGYGVSDYYFGGCWSPLLLVLMEVCCGISFAAVATSLLFLRVSRGHKRGKTVLFSDKAVFRRVRGIPHLMFRVVELRRHQLLGATVRAFVIRHERHAVAAPPPPSAVSESCSTNRTSDPLSPRERLVETVHYVTKPMRLLSEDTTTHDAILMSLPQVMVHRIDTMSPLRPPYPVWYDVLGEAHRQPAGLDLADGSLDEVRLFLQDREAEIVVILEGTDELTGTAIQSRHSYSMRDLSWDHAFVPCVYPYLEEDEQEEVGRRRFLGSFVKKRSDDRKPVCVVDFARFHNTAPAPSDCESCPYVVE